MNTSVNLEKDVVEVEIEKQEKNPKKKKGLFKYLLNVVIILLITGLSIFFSLKDNFEEKIDAIKNANLIWILVIFGVMLLIILVRSFILFCFARLFTRKYNIAQSMAVDQIGVFYSSVSNTYGGQIMQAYTYKKQGLHISTAVSALAMYAIVYQVVLIIYGLVSFIVKFDLITGIGNINLQIENLNLNLQIWPLTILGFVVNISVILVIFLMGYWHRFHNFIMGPVVSFLAKIKIVKNPDKTRENLRIQVENFKIELRRLLSNIPFTLLVAFCFFIFLTLKFSIPYFCGLALGNSHTDAYYFWDSIFLSNYHQMVSGLIPIPGGAGISEFFFTKLFYDGTSNGFYFLTNSEDSLTLTYAAMLIWRSITFVIPIIIAGFVTAFYKAAPKEEAFGKRKSEYQTFVSMKALAFTDEENFDDSMDSKELSKQAVMKELQKEKSERLKEKARLRNSEQEGVDQ